MKNNIKTTESSNIASKDIDTKSISDIISIFNGEDLKIIESIKESSADIEEIIKYVVSCLQNDGRLFYVGAGTSGRLGIMDAAECSPTFGVDKNIVQGIIAGGDIAAFESIEGAEDKTGEVLEIINNKMIGSDDIVIGISCSGTARFVLEFLKESKSKGSVTSLITFNDVDEIKYIDKILRINVGAEIITGSTRMKSGTATKMVLNMISSISMIKLNKTYGNYMVDLKVMNKKLLNRAVNIISSLTGLNIENSEKILLKSNKSVKNAIIMHELKLSFKESEKLLKKYNGSLRNLLDEEK